jgi:hypothetical protein
VLREFQDYEFCWFCSDVGDRGETAGRPSYFAGLDAFRPGRLAFYRAAQVDVGYGYQQVRALVVVRGDCGAGLEFEFAGADSVFYEEDLLGASGESFQGSVFIPMDISVGGGIAEGVVGYDFYGYVAERLVGLIADYVREGGGGEGDLAVLEFDGYGRLVFYGVDYFGCAQVDGEVVVTVTVHEGFGVGQDFYVVDADIFVFEGEVVVGLGEEFDFGGCGLGGQEGCY